LAVRHQLDVLGGVIDADARGNVRVILINYSATPLHIHAGVRVAQLICEKIVYPDICEVQEIDATKLGTEGFGSTVCN
jgi:dUTP pyrophosphatase